MEDGEPISSTTNLWIRIVVFVFNIGSDDLLI